MDLVSEILYAGLVTLMLSLPSASNAHGQELQAVATGWDATVQAPPRQSTVLDRPAKLRRQKSSRSLRRERPVPPFGDPVPVAASRLSQPAAEPDRGAVRAIIAATPANSVPAKDHSGSSLRLAEPYSTPEPLPPVTSHSAKPIVQVSADAPASIDPAIVAYCQNLVPVAGDARAAFLLRTIASVEQELARKTAALEARIGEHKTWIERRRRLADIADASLVRMFALMKPDAAGQRIAVLDESLAASLLMKLEARAASAILSEISPDKAARVTSIIATAAGADQQRPQTTSAPANPSRKADNPP
jgi:hypothetical protein